MPKFNKKHYEAIAQVIASENQNFQTIRADDDFLHGKQKAIQDVMSSFLVLFAYDNPLFNKEKFIEACFKFNK